MENKTEFWLNDYSVLYRNGNYQDFIPTHKMNRTEKLNAITRLAIYFYIVNYLFNGNNEWSYLSIGLIVISILMNVGEENDPDKNQKQINKIIEKKIEEREKEKEFKKELYEKEEKNDEKEFSDFNDKPSYDMEMGTFDENGELAFAENPSINELKGQKEKEIVDLFSSDELDLVNKRSCRKPTENNPFMNYSINDFNNGETPQACNVEDDEISQQSIDFFNKDLYRNVGDIFEIHNSQRQFYSMPHTKVPPDTIELANWLYKTPATCKEDQANCLEYDGHKQRLDANRAKTIA